VELIVYSVSNVSKYTSVSVVLDEPTPTFPHGNELDTVF
jgi:hypothetical protein